MSFRGVIWALKQDLPPTQKLLLVALASHASTEDGSCFPKVRTLAREASISSRTVHRLLPKLQAKGFVRIEQNYRGKARLPHTYWVSCPLERKARNGRRDVDRRSYDARGRTENHYSNHNVSQRCEHHSRHSNTARIRNKPTPEQMADQAALNELVRRLGPDGWAIVATFSDEVPRLCAQLRNGTITTAQLLELKTRYAASVGDK